MPVIVTYTQGFLCKYVQFHSTVSGAATTLTQQHPVESSSKHVTQQQLPPCASCIVANMDVLAHAAHAWLHVCMQYSQTAQGPTGLPYDQASVNLAIAATVAAETTAKLQKKLTLSTGQPQRQLHPANQQPIKGGKRTESNQGSCVCMQGLLRQACLKSTRVSNKHTSPQNRGRGSIKTLLLRHSIKTLTRWHSKQHKSRQVYPMMMAFLPAGVSASRALLYPAACAAQVASGPTTGTQPCMAATLQHQYTMLVHYSAAQQGRQQQQHSVDNPQKAQHALVHYPRGQNSLPRVQQRTQRIVGRGKLERVLRS